jgi:hypothetical protein
MAKYMHKGLQLFLVSWSGWYGLDVMLECIPINVTVIAATQQVRKIQKLHSGLNQTTPFLQGLSCISDLADPRGAVIAGRVFAIRSAEAWSAQYNQTAQRHRSMPAALPSESGSLEFSNNAP